MTKRPVPVGRPALLRYTNAISLLGLLREAGSCSKADLVRASGLSAPTVTNVVAYLQSADLIAPLGGGESSGGRPPDIIRFKAERGCVAAVEINTRTLRFLLTDLNGEQLQAEEVPVRKSARAPHLICATMQETLTLMLRRQKKTRAHLVALSVGVPAITNVQDGVVLAISPLGWSDVPLRAMLEKLFPCPVLVENDTNLAALGERFRGAARHQDDFVYIAIGAGVGAGIVLGGNLHRGSQWSAGEIGYLRLPNVSNKQPAIHEFGELEKVVASSGIEESWLAQKSTGKENTGKEQPARLKAQAILDLAAEGDKRAKKIVDLRAQLLADLILNIALILNPSRVLLGGEIGAHPVLLQRVQSLLAQSEFAVPHIESGALGTGAVLWGGVQCALQTAIPLLMP